MVSSRLAASVVAVLAIASVALWVTPRSGATAAGSIGFEVPTVVDPIHTNGEPDIAVDKFGRVFVSGPTGTGTQRSTWFGSVDGGQTFRVMTQKLPPSSVIGIPAPQPGGGDTDINFDRTGKQYFTDLYALACLRVAVTTDGGAHDTENVLPGGCAGIPGSDRQWLAVFDPSPQTQNLSEYRTAHPNQPLVYLEYNSLIGTQWNMSTDGLNYVNATADEAPPGAGITYSPFGADGYPAIDQVTGQVLQAAGCDSSRCGHSSAATPGLYMNIGTPDSTGMLHFLDDAGSGVQDLTRLVKVADTPTGSPDVLFSVVSMDDARNLFAVWAIGSSDASKRQIWVSASSAASGWRTWSPAVQVSDGMTSTGDATNVFPWIKAGGNGMANAVWYGSDLQVDPSSQMGQSWNVFMSQVRYDSTAKTVSLLTQPPIKVSPHPMHYNDICLAGSDCIASQGDRNLADFFEINIDRTGAAEIVYDDTSNGLTQPGFVTPIVSVAGNPIKFIDHPGAGVITIARQSSGLGLKGVTVTGRSNTPASGLGDPAGDALYPVIGGSNQRGMDIRGSRLQLSADGKFLKVTMQAVDLANPAGTIANLVAAGDTGTTNLQYVTRWQMGDKIYYAAMETGGASPSFYAGVAQSIDLCSVSACFPHVITYPEADPGFTGKTELGTINCPSSPSADNPCTFTISVSVADIGSPNVNSLLEEVGAYSFSSTLRENAENNVSAEADTVPLEIDGVCCYNFKASVQNGGPGPCHEGDGEGDVSDGRGGKAHMRFDQDGCEDGDAESVQSTDSSTGDNFQSGRITAVTFNDALSNVTIVGTGTHNGSPVGFTLVAVNGAAGIGAVSLTLSDGYSIGGTLLAGAIQLQ